MSNHNMYFSKTCACQKRMSKPPKNSRSWCVGEAPTREVTRNIKAETVRQEKNAAFPSRVYWVASSRLSRTTWWDPASKTFFLYWGKNYFLSCYNFLNYTFIFLKKLFLNIQTVIWTTSPLVETTPTLGLFLRRPAFCLLYLVSYGHVDIKLCTWDVVWVPMQLQRAFYVCSCYVWAYMYVLVCTHVCRCLWRPEVNLGCSSSATVYLVCFVSQEFSPKPELQWLS